MPASPSETNRTEKVLTSHETKTNALSLDAFQEAVPRNFQRSVFSRINERGWRDSNSPASSGHYSSAGYAAIRGCSLTFIACTAAIAAAALAESESSR